MTKGSAASARRRTWSWGERARGHRDGALVSASGTGSHLGLYASGAGRVVLDVGATEVVADLNEPGADLRHQRVCRFLAELHAPGTAI